MSYPNLLTPFTLRGVTLGNRAIMALMSTELGSTNGAGRTWIIRADWVLLAQGGSRPTHSPRGWSEPASRYRSPVDSKQVGQIGDAVHMVYRAVLPLNAQYSPAAKPSDC